MNFKERDRVKVGFTLGTVVRVDGKKVLVQLDTGGLPHLVPKTSVRKADQ